MDDRTRTTGPARRGRNGIDAPYVPAGNAVMAVVCAVLAVVLGRWEWTVAAAVFAVSGGLFLHTTLRGKFVVWDELLDELELRGDEQVLDVGCGRGAVTVAVARRVPRGRVTGVDLWRRRDQSGNDPEATRANLAAAGVGDRVALETGDMRSLPFADDAFDLVVSSLAVHNLAHREDRDRAISEMARVLRPGGRLVVADLRHTDQYAGLLGRAVVRRGLGWRMWWGGPWAPTHAVALRGD